VIDLTDYKKFTMGTYGGNTTWKVIGVSIFCGLM